MSWVFVFKEGLGVDSQSQRYRLGRSCLRDRCIQYLIGEIVDHVIPNSAQLLSFFFNHLGLPVFLTGFLSPQADELEASNDRWEGPAELVDRRLDRGCVPSSDGREVCVVPSGSQANHY